MSLCTSAERDSESPCYQKALEMVHRQLPLSPVEDTCPTFYEDISTENDCSLFANYSNPVDKCEDEVGTYREQHRGIKMGCTEVTEKRKSFEGNDENAQDPWWSASPPNLFLRQTNNLTSSQMSSPPSFSQLRSPPSFPWNKKRSPAVGISSSDSSSSSTPSNDNKNRETKTVQHSDPEQQKRLQNRLECADKKNREKTSLGFNVGTQTSLGDDVTTQKIATRRTPTPPIETDRVKGNDYDIKIVLNRDYWACRNNACILRPISLNRTVVLPAKEGVIVSTNILFAHDTDFYSGINGLESHMYPHVCELQCNWMEAQCKSIIVVKEGPIRPGFSGRLYLYVFNKTEKSCTLAERTPIASLKTCHYMYPL